MAKRKTQGSSPPPPPHVIATLVHGTYGRKSSWTKSSSSLFKELEKAGCQVKRCEWTGRNSHRARIVAAKKLSKELQEQAESHPDARQWVIAHSHGGNVALHAIEAMSQARRKRSKISTITLATPFIHARPRVHFGWLVFIAILFSAMAIIASVTAFVNAPESPFEWTLTLCGGLIDIAIILTIIGALMHRRRSWNGYRAQLPGTIHAPTADKGKVIVFRAAGDEASGGLIAGQFIGWMNAISSRHLSNIYLWAMVIFAMQASFIVGALLDSPSGFEIGWSMMQYLFLGLGFAVTTPLALMLLSSLTFGIDGPFVAIFAACSAEASPPGRVQTIQLQPSIGSERKGLSHTYLYNDMQVIREIIAIIQADIKRKG